MNIHWMRLTNVAAGILVFCAIVSTILVVRREFFPTPTSALATELWSATYVDEWQDAFTVGIRLGSKDAPVQFVEFEDFQCPYCARFDEVVTTIRERYPDQVAFTFVPLPMPYHEFAEPAQRAAECAHNQGSFEEMRSLLFEKQQDFESTVWTRFAIQANVGNISVFTACVNATNALERIEQSKVIADKLGVRGTPTVFVNGWRLPRTPSLDVVDKIVMNVVEGREPIADIDFVPSVARN